MSDPRQEARENATIQRHGFMPTQPMERIKQKLSPCDDDLPFAQAVRQKAEMDKAAAAFGKRQTKRGE